MKYMFAAVVVVLLVPAVATAYDTTTVYLIQQETYEIGYEVFVDSVVVTNVDLMPTTYGFHVQELEGGPYSGILVYSGGPPVPTVEVGDLVSVWGYYDEYYNHSEIQISTGGYQVITPGFGAPECTLLSCADLADSAHFDTLGVSERWEGVFVCVDTVRVLEIGGFGDFTFEEAHYDTGTGLGEHTYTRADDKCVDPTLPMPTPGDTLVLVRGTFAEEYETYRIWPRTAADVIYLRGSPPPSVVSAYATSRTSMQVVFDMPMDELSAEDADNYSLESTVPIISAELDLVDSLTVTLVTGNQLTAQRDSIIVCDVQSAVGSPMTACEKLGFRAGITPISAIQIPADTTDASPMDGERVTTTGIIVHADSCYGGPFFMQAKEGGPWNGIYVYTFLGGEYEVCDSVVVSGFVQEYYNWTEISGVDYVNIVAHAVPFSGPTVVTPDLLQAEADTAESYESVYCKMDSVEVFTYLDANGEWWCGTGTDSVQVGDFTCVYNPCYDFPGVGSWIRIRGPVRWHFGEYKFEPRGNYDIAVLDSCTAGVRDGEKLALRLAQNAPNPFVGETMIKFSVPRKMNVKLSVYDISGRLVKTLAEGDMDAGEQSFAWDGRDASARSVSPGIYFLRMSTPERSLQKKMVLLH